jgi:enamine deaminase RidA (YjgF/YER057c/UK114 family)
MLNKYLIFKAQIVSTIEKEWIQCLDQIISAEKAGSRLVKLNIFTNYHDYNDFIKNSGIIGTSIINHFGDICPAFNITAHPPESPWNISVEAGYMDNSSCEIVSKFNNSISYVVRTSGTEKEVWAGGLGGFHYPEDTRKAAWVAFDQMRAILEAEQMSFNHIVRQWNFIGNILKIENDAQNYQLFNEVRSENYHKYRSIHSYPAATGISMKNGGVRLDFCAIKTVGNLKVIAIDNPDQIRPYDYSQQVLRGKPLEGKVTKQPPRFERAVFLSNSSNSTLFVSGTASIIGQETIGVDDVGRQTVVTIENISKLTDSKRIGHLIGKPDYKAGELILLRVYIKKQEDFAKVKAICEEFHPGVPSVFIESDICRENLLVEIEAELTKIN